MKNKFLKISAAVLFACTLAGISYYYYVPPATCATECIRDYDEARDMDEILQIFKDNWYWLVSSENYSPEFMLKNHAPSKEDTRYYGKLIIKVLYECEKLVGFTAYYMKNFFMGTLLFIAIKPEFRSKGYAQQLMKHAIADLKKNGASIITLVTRTTNDSAQRLYKKLGFTVAYEDNGYVYFELRP